MKQVVLFQWNTFSQVEGGFVRRFRRIRHGVPCWKGCDSPASVRNAHYACFCGNLDTSAQTGANLSQRGVKTYGTNRNVDVFRRPQSIDRVRDAVAY